MGLRRISEPEGQAVTLEEVKAHLAIEFDDHDDMLEGMIAEATDLLDGKDGELQRCIMPQTWEWTLDDWPAADADGGQAFKVPLPPLIEVVSIVYRDPDGAEQTLDPDAGAYQVDSTREPGWIAPGVDGWPSVQSGMNRITITFRAGYAGDGSSGNSPVPPTLRRLVKEMVAHMYEHRGDEGGVDLPALTREKMDLFRVYAA